MTEPMAYMGRKSCGCVVAIIVDMPEYKKETAKEIARWIESGLAVERVTIATARQSYTGCIHTVQQQPLFEDQQ